MPSLITVASGTPAVLNVRACTQSEASTWEPTRTRTLVSTPLDGTTYLEADGLLRNWTIEQCPHEPVVPGTAVWPRSCGGAAAAGPAPTAASSSVAATTSAGGKRVNGHSLTGSALVRNRTIAST
jgi:hypothetical protein